MTNATDPGWDYHLEEAADQLVRDILDTGAHRQPEVLKLDAVPLFLWQDGAVGASPRSILADSWQDDPENDANDLEFIQELRRTDLLPGSFFVLLWPGKGKSYPWRLHTP